MEEQGTTDFWKGFSTFIYDSYSGPKKEFANSNQSQQNSASFSLLLTVGGQETAQLLHESSFSQDEISLIHWIFLKIEKLCLLKLIIEYEKYTQFSKTTEVNNLEYKVSANLSISNIDKCNDNDTAFQYSLGQAHENKTPENANDANLNVNTIQEKSSSKVETDKKPNDIQVQGSTPNSLTLHSYNSNNLPWLKNTSIDNIADNVETSTIRRSSRQVRVSSRYAEDKDAIKKLLKPSVRTVTGIDSEVTNSILKTQCSVCLKNFPSFKALKNHLKSHKQSSKCKKHEELSYPCKICGSKFEKLCQLEVHFKGHKQNENMNEQLEHEKCESLGCSTETMALSQEDTHSNDLDEKKVSQDSKLLEEEEIFKCNSCCKSYESEKDLLNHKASCKSFGEKLNFEKKILLEGDFDLSHGKIDSDLDKEQNGNVNFKTHEHNEEQVEAVSKKKIVDHIECIYCLKVFKYRSHLNLHMTVHTGEKPHICEICGQRFRIKPSLIRHKRTHNEMFRLKCEFCPKTYFDEKALENHKLSHTGVKPYSCEICGKGFRRYLGFKNHQRLHKQEEAFRCNECNKTFVDKWGLLKHKTVHSGEKPHVCVQCGKGFRLKKGLQEHIKIHDKQLQLKCNLCPRTFVDQRKLDLHLMAHKGEKPFICHKCGKSFMNASTLKVHDRCHTGEKPYKCKYCDMTFNQQGPCTAHERHHKGDRPYVCEICSEGFITKSHLTVHKRRHFNDRPYKCDECDYAAYTGSILRIHMIKHSKEKPFKCQLCPAAFKRQHHLDVHGKTHQSKVVANNVPVNEVVDVVFKCPYCGECFDSEKQLTGHIDTHEIVVVTETAANYDGISNEGEPDEVAYNIVVL